MKYIFIDSNQYRHLFSSSEGFSKDIYNLLINLIEKKHADLILPQQTKDEVIRHIFGDWKDQNLNSIKSKIDTRKKYLEYEKSLKGYVKWDALKKEIEKEICGFEKDLKTVEAKFSSKNSKSHQKLKNLFDRAKIVDDSEELFRKAEIRMKKGNPPYNQDKIGDSLIWESILFYIKGESAKKPGLFIIASDNKAWGNDTCFHRFLQDEYKNLFSDGSVEIATQLSKISLFTKQEQEKIEKDERENLKNNTIDDFMGSDSFIAAGKNANKLLLYKDILCLKDLEKIIESSNNNYQIYQSIFTSSALKLLFLGDNDYVIREAEKISASLWRQFVEKYKINLKRQIDEKTEQESTLEEHIPF